MASFFTLKPRALSGVFNLDYFLSIILPYEGEGITSNNKLDRGGLTKSGVTLSTLKTAKLDINGDGIVDAEDLKLMQTKHIPLVLLRTGMYKAYLDAFSPEHAFFLINFVWSGHTSVKFRDEILSPLFSNYSFSSEQPIDVDLLMYVYESRFYRRIIERLPEQIIHMRGWMRKLLQCFFRSRYHLLFDTSAAIKAINLKPYKSK